jgi:hypothetical protein
MKMVQPKSSIADVWFYVNPSSQEIDAVYCFSPLGMTTRENYDWQFTRREDSKIDQLPADDIYQLNWESDETPMTEDFDFDSYDAVTHAALKLYDRGELTLDELKKYASLLVSGESSDSAPITEEG